MSSTLEQITFTGSGYEQDTHRCLISPQEVARLICSQLVILENGPVFAIAGNAVNTRLQSNIQAVKGEERGDAPVGATMPFDDPFVEGIFKTTHMTAAADKVLRNFLENPAEQTARFGGLSFLRGPADLAKKEAQSIPDSIIPVPSAEEIGSTVQVYSPVGNTKTEAIVRAIRELKGISVMTSANKTGTPEIIYEDQVVGFARETGLPLITRVREEDKPARPRSSYPISSIMYSHQAGRWELTPVRTGCFAVDILLPLHEGLPHAKIIEPVTKHPDKVLHMNDLPKRAWNAKANELRKWVLQTAGLDL